MSYLHIYMQVLIIILIIMTFLWIVSIIIKNASIADLFWGMGFVVAAGFYFLKTEGLGSRKIILLTLVAVWGLRLSIYLFWRNAGKGEDFRYRKFRIRYGEKRYWWISFFQTFILQGILIWLISAPLLGAQFYGKGNPLCLLDFAGIAFWITGMFFEAGGDFQLSRFRSDPLNKGKVLNKGFWRYTRHPNYFGDTMIWWGFGLICIASGSYLPVMGSLLMTAMIIKVSGVALLEESLTVQKPQYREYIEKTSAFLPWFPKK